MYKLSKRSLSRLAECHEDLQMLAVEAISASPYDFGITHGHRTSDEQKKLYNKGRDKEGNIIDKKKIVTYVDGYIKKSKHNASPSEAFDIVCYVNGQVVWTHEVYKIVASHILEVAEDLFEKGFIENRIVWGGNFRGFVDAPHFQI